MATEEITGTNCNFFIDINREFLCCVERIAVCNCNGVFCVCFCQWNVDFYARNSIQNSVILWSNQGLSTHSLYVFNERNPRTTREGATGRVPQSGLCLRDACAVLCCGVQIHEELKMWMRFLAGNVTLSMVAIVIVMILLGGDPFYLPFCWIFFSAVVQSGPLHILYWLVHSSHLTPHVNQTLCSLGSNPPNMLGVIAQGSRVIGSNSSILNSGMSAGGSSTGSEKRITIRSILSHEKAFAAFLDHLLSGMCN